jgi:hypothetical protein
LEHPVCPIFNCKWRIANVLEHPVCSIFIPTYL